LKVKDPLDETNAALKAEGHADVYELPQLPPPVVIGVLGLAAAFIAPEAAAGGAVGVIVRGVIVRTATQFAS
jgi:hypothetical protein